MYTPQVPIAAVPAQRSSLLSKRQNHFSNRLRMGCHQNYDRGCTASCRNKQQQHFEQVVTTIIQISIVLVLPNGLIITFELTFISVQFSGGISIGPFGGAPGTDVPVIGSSEGAGGATNAPIGSVQTNVQPATTALSNTAIASNPAQT
ncbi:unnamed protein product, partial [Didymodactylos carnosus]